jgi:hypothetical protein
MQTAKGSDEGVAFGRVHGRQDLRVARRLAR